MSDAPKIVVFDRDWAEPHDGTGEGGEARVYTLNAESATWRDVSPADVLSALRDGSERRLWDLLGELDQEHVDYDVEPQRGDWSGYWVLHVAPGGETVKAVAP